MNIVAFNGSPAGADSATYKIIAAFLSGAQRGGAEAKVFHLGDYVIKQCQGCFSCWFRSPGKCMVQDNMAELLQAYQTADVVCFASPVYSWNMTALLKNFVDRLVPLKSPCIVNEQEHFDMADTAPREQRHIAISNCGFPGVNNFEIIKAAFSCCNPVLEIYRNCGKLLRSQNPSVAGIVTEYLSAVDQAGYELATAGQVSAQTRERLDMPLMSTPQYVQFLGM